MISGDEDSFSGGTVYICLEDTSFADAPAEIIAETRLEEIEHNTGSLKEKTVIEFCLNFDETRIDPKNIYSLRVWINTNGSGKAGGKDLTSSEFYPVLTRGAGDFVNIRVVSSG